MGRNGVAGCSDITSYKVIARLTTVGKQAKEIIVHAALLVIDMQNGFIHPNGSLRRSGATLLDPGGAIQRTAELIAQARAMELPVVYTRHEHRHGYLDATDYVKRVYEPFNGLLAGTWDAQIIDELAPHSCDQIISKNRYDAFLNTDLDLLLRALGVRSLLFAGVTTHACVDSSARAADMRNFEVIVTTDCTSTMPELYNASLACLNGVGISTMPWRQGLLAVTH